jgi:hypothetical protein
MAIKCSSKTTQVSKLDMGQTVYRQWFHTFVPTLTGVLPAAITGVTLGGDIVLVGVPATPANVFVHTMPPGIIGRILRFGLKFSLVGFIDNGWAGGDTEGTISLDQIAQGGAALANIANVVLPQVAPLAAVINDAEYVDNTVALAGGVPPRPFAGGDCFYAYTSVARVIAAAGITGVYVPFMDFVIDQITEEATAAVRAYLMAV